jgi:hypothetical protein
VPLRRLPVQCSSRQGEPDYRSGLDGAVNVPAFILPFSVCASPEAQLHLQQKFERLSAMRTPAAIGHSEGTKCDTLTVKSFKDHMNPSNQ